MKTELFTYELVDQNNTQLRIKRTVWWMDDHIQIIHHTGGSLNMTSDELLNHLREINFSERCLQIIGSILKGLQTYEKEKEEANG